MAQHSTHSTAQTAQHGTARDGAARHSTLSTLSSSRTMGALELRGWFLCFGGCLLVPVKKLVRIPVRVPIKEPPSVQTPIGASGH